MNTCSAPEVTDSSVYFTTANNIARLSYDQHSGVASDVTRGDHPEKVWLGKPRLDRLQRRRHSVRRPCRSNRITRTRAKRKQLTMQLSQRYNRYRPTTQTQTITDGSYRFGGEFSRR